LNSLDDNLRVGDSVIEDSSFTHRAFSWKEVFPEVFKDGGFDVVLGNPPYVRQEFISPMKPYLEKRYEVYNGIADLYTYFFELALRILKPNVGRMGYICSSTFFKTSSGENLRKYLSEKSEIDTIIDFGDIQVFEGVTTYPAIVVINHELAEKDHKINILQLENDIEDDIAKHFELYAQSMPQNWLDTKQWNLQSEELFLLKQKIADDKNTLKEIYGSPLYGIKTGLNEAFIIDSNTKNILLKNNSKSNDLIVPFIEGKDLQPKHLEPRELSLLFIPKGFTKSKCPNADEENGWNFLEENYPEIAKHLEIYKEKAIKRSDKGDFWWELRACDYYDKFTKPKIIWPEISRGAKFILDKNNYYTNKTVFIFPYPDSYLLGLLNSNTIWFYLRQICTALRGGVWRLNLQSIYTETIPIPKATNEQKEQIGLLAEKAQDTAEKRYALQEQVRNRIHDIAPEGREYKLNGKLKSWWELDFKEFQKQIKSIFKRELKLSERDEWEDYLKGKRKKVEELNNTLNKIENDLNTEVYKLFDLTPDEIKLIEENV